jgi:hypothetical protein
MAVASTVIQTVSESAALHSLGDSASLSESGGSDVEVATTLNYYNDPGDGSLPEPVYVQK